MAPSLDWLSRCRADIISLNKEPIAVYSLAFMGGGLEGMVVTAGEVG